MTLDYENDLAAAASATPAQARNFYRRWFELPGAHIWISWHQQQKLAESLLHREGLAQNQKEWLCRRYKLSQRD